MTSAEPRLGFCQSPEVHADKGTALVAIACHANVCGAKSPGIPISLEGEWVYNKSYRDRGF